MEINLHQEIIKLLINTLHNCNNSITVICSEEETDNFKLNSNLTVKFKKLTVTNQTNLEKELFRGNFCNCEL
jgi:hypothetical protein